MTSEKSAEVVLARLCQTARKALDPQLNTSAIEAAVMARVARSSVDSKIVPRRTSRSYVVPAAALAVAAAVVLVAAQWLDQQSHPMQASTRGQLAAEPGMDGALLVVGQVVEARDHDLTIKHGGMATWRLRAPGHVRVIETGRRITLALDHGRVDAEVTPQPQPEALAIEVEQLRVAVHGTVFSVERRGDTAEVVVKEGRVRVGSNHQRGATEGQLLTAPSRLNIDVRPEAPGELPGATASKVPAKHPHPAGTASSHPAVDEAAPPTLTERPSVVEVERIWEAVAHEIADCFAAQTGGDPNLRVSFATQIQIGVAPGGEISVVGFNPPVPENVQGCAEQRATLLRTDPTLLGTFINRPKVLTR